MKLFALLLLALAQISCTTLVNRRDLYSPEPAPGAMRPVTKTTTTTTTTRSEPEEIIPPPQFR